MFTKTLKFEKLSMSLKQGIPLLLTSLLLMSPKVYSEDALTAPDVTLEKCEISIVNNDIEVRYQEMQKNLEQDYKQGLPHQLKSDLIEIRKEVDNLTTQSFDLESNNTQEMNLMVQKTIDKLERMISLIPKVSQWVPKVRSQYVIPFTNINSIKAEHQDCLMKMAVNEVQKESAPVVKESSENIYKKLTSELNQLNDNLYRLETTDLEKFIGLRSELLNHLETYNKNQNTINGLSKEIPLVLNSLQTEIERLIPGLELSKKYLSLVD